MVHAERYFGFFLAVVSSLFVTSSAAGTCQDGLVECPDYLGSCGNDLVNMHCPKTCNICSSGPCSENNGGCNHYCLEVGVLALCSCRRGFRLSNDTRTCVDINECTEGSNPCSVIEPRYCLNNEGSYSCQAYICNELGQMNYYRSGACCKLPNSSCGITEDIKKKIEDQRKRLARGGHRVLGGRDAPITAWPWQAQILFRGGIHCGATLISNKWLVCAAHCFNDSPYSLMIVYLGHVRSAPFQRIEASRRQQRRIAQLIIHEDYNDEYDNDIALIRLDEPLEFNEIISPICLPCGETPNVGDRCWVTGFGQTTLGGEPAETLQEVDVPIVDHDECAESYRDLYTIIRDGMVCAGYPEGERDACLGDSGGPMACQRADSCEWYLSGVTSFGRGCGLPGFYGVYTNVANYEPWIRESIGDDLAPCSKRYNVCKRFANVDDECYSMLDACKEFPFYMGAKCKLACCQKENQELPEDYCSDAPEMASLCSRYLQYCSNPLFQKYMKEKCKRTCSLC